MITLHKRNSGIEQLVGVVAEKIGMKPAVDIERNMICLSDICQAGEKTFEEYNQSKSAQIFINYLQIVVKFPLTNLIYTADKIWGHPYIAYHLCHWLNVKKFQRVIEEENKLKNNPEHYFGIIDVLSETDIIEIKMVYNWKHALDQILECQSKYPNYEKNIYLFKRAEQKVIDTCNKFIINIIYM